MVHEDNSGDYFPLHDEILANEIVDPLPKSAVDLLNKLGPEATAPGSGKGQCMSEKYFDDEDGRETRALLAYDCKAGLLIYLWSPSCCYGVMTDYRKFHNKLVAFATKDDPINIRIDTLRDLDSAENRCLRLLSPVLLPNGSRRQESVRPKRASALLRKPRSCGPQSVRNRPSTASAWTS